MDAPPPLPYRRIVAFWSPLFATWLMMSVEGPFLAALIARRPDATTNLAAYGVAFALALLAEAPVIQMPTAATAVVEDRASYLRLRAFAFGLSGAITLALAVALPPPVYGLWAGPVLGLPPAVADRTWLALCLLLPWPGAIGYRRFFQGVLIRAGRTRRVAYGTLVRLSAMGGTAFLLYRSGALPGAALGAAALSVGVTAEAAVSRFMAAPVVRDLAAAADPGAVPPRWSDLTRFYFPLALTSVVTLGIQPMITLFVARAARPVESLAVLPVLNALTFLFRSAGLSYQEVAIAILARDGRHLPRVRNFAIALGTVAAAGLAAMAWTSLGPWWYGTVSGLGPALAAFAIPPTRLLAPLPFLSVMLALQRAVLVHGRRTAPVTWGTLGEAGGALLILAWAVGAGWVGVVAAAVALLGGRLVDNAMLVPPYRRIAAGRSARHPHRRARRDRTHA